MPFSPINDGNSPSYSVSNLKPATSYKICVAAKNLGNYLLSKESCITRETMEDSKYDLLCELRGEEREEMRREGKQREGWRGEGRRRREKERKR